MKKQILHYFVPIISMIILTACAKDPLAVQMIDQIKSIGEVSLDDESSIIELEDLYSNMTDKQKDQVKNYVDLVNARKELNALKKEEEERLAEENRKKNISAYISKTQELFDKIQESEFDFETKIEFFGEMVTASTIYTAENIRAITSTTDTGATNIRREAKDLYDELRSMTCEEETTELKSAVEEYYLAYGKLCDLLLDYNFTQVTFNIYADSYMQEYESKKSNLESALNQIA